MIEIKCHCCGREIKQEKPDYSNIHERDCRRCKWHMEAKRGRHRYVMICGFDCEPYTSTDSGGCKHFNDE